MLEGKLDQAPTLSSAMLALVYCRACPRGCNTESEATDLIKRDVTLMQGRKLQTWCAPAGMKSMPTRP